MGSAAPHYPELRGKVAVVTGAARGMGGAFAHGLAAQGVRVIAGDIDRDRVLATAADDVGPYGGSVSPLEVDVTVLDGHVRAAALAHERFGRLDYWINNAGVLTGSGALEISPEELQTTFAVNAAGTVFGSQTAAKMIGPDGGAIVNVTSLTALRPRPGRGAYAMSKAAADHFTHILAVELGACGVRVNAIAPGLVATEMIGGLVADPARVAQVVEKVPLGRLGTPEDILDVALFLLSDSARFVHGATIVVDGGESRLS